MLLLLTGLLVAGCVSGPSLKPLADTPQGTVWLEHLSERGTSATWGGQTRAFHATHPVSLNPALIDQFLGGIRIQTQRSPQPTTQRVEGDAVPVFSKETRDFLVPAIAYGLTQASYDERLQFKIYHHTETESAITVGTLFVNSPTIQMSLKRYRAKSSFGQTTGLEGREVAFVPEAARVLNAPPQSWVLTDPLIYTVSVNYENLARLVNVEQPVPPASLPAGAPPMLDAAKGGTAAPSPPPLRSVEDVQGMKDALSRQEKELEALREALRSLERQLGDRGADIGSKSSSK